MSEIFDLAWQDADISWAEADFSWDNLSADIGSELIRRLQPFMRNSRLYRAIFDAIALQLAQSVNDIGDFEQQRLISTATYALDNYEKDFGLTRGSIKPIDERRSALISKLRGYGTISVAQMRNVANAFENGTVEVIESPATYSFILRFTSVRGIPPNLNDLQAAVDLVKPAHLTVSYVFSYLRWEEIDAVNKTWDQLDAMGFTWDQIDTWHPS